MARPHEPDPFKPPESGGSDGDVNAYAPPSPTAPESSDSTLPAVGEKNIDYPGGIWSVLAVGVLLGFAFGFAFGSGQRVRVLPYELLIFLGIILWVGSFALLGALLRGTAKQRRLRAALMAFISVPAYILYVPVCVVGTIVLGEGPEALLRPPLKFATAVTISSVISVLMVIAVAAIVLRTVTRRRLRQQPPPHRSSKYPPPNE